MARITVLDNDYATLWFDTDANTVHHKMHKFLPSAVFRDLLSAGLVCLEDHRASRWLSDDRDNPAAVRLQDAQWADTVWAPRVVRAGFRYWAIVMPRHAIGRMQMRKLMADYEQRGVTVRAFDAPEEARLWLASTSDERPAQEPQLNASLGLEPHDAQLEDVP